MWAVAGVALLAFEVTASGALFALFIGIGALLVAPLAAVDLPASVQWFAFAAFSLLGLATVRGPLLRRISRSQASQAEIIGEQAHALTDLATGTEGRVELRGTTWTARLDGTAPVARGQRCLVTRVEGLTLWVRPE